jgi:hypothetical protein
MNSKIKDEVTPSSGNITNAMLAAAPTFKTCNGCKALSYAPFSLSAECRGYSCSLGYGIDTVKAKPMSYCPKPKTNYEMKIEMSLRRCR